VTSLATRGVGFRSITEAIDTTTPGGSRWERPRSMPRYVADEAAARAAILAMFAESSLLALFS
jgi:hypothetical protein